MDKMKIFLFCASVLLLSGCQSAKTQKLEEQWAGGNYIENFEVNGTAYTIDMGTIAVEMAEILGTDSWIYGDELYKAFQNWETDVRFYYERNGGGNGELEVAMIFEDYFEYQGRTYKMALYPDLGKEENLTHIISPNIEMIASKEDKDSSIDFFEKNLNIDYTYIGRVEDFKFPEKFEKPVFSRADKKRTKGTKLYKEPPVHWPEEYACGEGTVYLQYWNGFSDYFRVVYQDSDNQRYYEVIVDAEGNIQEEPMFIERDVYERICEIGVKIKV